MNLSYQEKSLWISLVTTIMIFGYYFAVTFQSLNAVNVERVKIIVNFIGVIVLVVIVQTVFQSILAFILRKEAEQKHDERERLIELKATRNSYFLLIFGLWMTGICMLFTESTLMLANVIMFFFILAEVVGFVSQLIYYRKGV